MELELHQLDRKYQALRIRDPRQQVRWLASLSQGASVGAVLVVAGTAPGRFVLIDGHARVAALEQLGRDSVEALVLPLAEAEALIFAYRLAGAGRRCALEEGCGSCARCTRSWGFRCASSPCASVAARAG
jgi:hypothetical protein